MKKDGKNAESPKMLSYVFGLFLIAFVIHAFLNIWLVNGPTVVIDEGLYTNIARSLAWDGELAFRGQPIDYPYLCYPILLVPVYWLNHLLKGDIYRYVQVFNTLLITSSVFPAYLFARDFAEDEKKSFAAALLVTLMPDMVMGGYEMTECLLWPLALWLFFFGYRFFTRNSYTYGVLTAVIAGLMFFSKPGAIVMGAVILIACLLFAAKDKGKQIKPAVISLLVLLLMIGAIYGLYLALFHDSSSIIGLYSKQTEEWKSRDILVAAEATLLLIVLFAFACGGLFFLLPLAFIHHYSDKQRRFIGIITVGLIAVLIGIAVFVVPYKWDGSLGKLPLHLRYCPMFIPVYFVFAMAVEVPYKKMGKRLLSVLAVLVALFLFPGARSGFVKGKTGAVDSFALSAFTTTKRLNGTVVGWFVTVFVIAFILYFMFNTREGWGKTLQRKSTIFFAAFLLINAICAHINANVYIDPLISKDAQEVNAVIGHQKCLGVTQRYYDDIYSYWLDGHLNAPMQQVTIDQMYIEMESAEGVYSPFVPVEQSPNVNNHATPDTDTLVLGMTIAEHLEMSQSVQAYKTKNGFFTVATIQPGERWVDSMLYGMDGNTLYSGQEGYLHIFDPMRGSKGTIELHICAAGQGDLFIQNQPVALTGTEKEYILTIPAAKLITIRAEKGNAQILSYFTK